MAALAVHGLVVPHVLAATPAPVCAPDQNLFAAHATQLPASRRYPEAQALAVAAVAHAVAPGLHGEAAQVPSLCKNLLAAHKTHLPAPAAAAADDDDDDVVSW